MADTVVEALTLDLLGWLASGDRTYEETMDAWRTSCPKLPVWEDAIEWRTHLARELEQTPSVRRASQGIALLRRSRSPQRPE